MKDKNISLACSCWIVWLWLTGRRWAQTLWLGWWQSCGYECVPVPPGTGSDISNARDCSGYLAAGEEAHAGPYRSHPHWILKKQHRNTMKDLMCQIGRY